MMNEKLSDWVDGELEQEEGRRVLQSIMRNESERQACELYWLIGDALRGSAGDGRLDVSVGSRVMAALEDEPTILAPRGPARSPAPPPALNRWFSAAAALGGVAVVGWMSLALLGGGNEPRPVAAALPQAVVLPVTAAASVPAAGTLGGEQAYYMAHQAAAIGAPMPGVAQYIRTVGDEQVGRR